MGDFIQGAYVYDSDPVTNPDFSPPGGDTVAQYATARSLPVRIGGAEYATDNFLGIAVFGNSSSITHGYDAGFSIAAPTIGEFEANSISVTLRDFDFNQFPTVNLPSAPPPLGEFETRAIQLLYTPVSGSGVVVIEASVTAHAVAADVPGDFDNDGLSNADDPCPVDPPDVPGSGGCPGGTGELDTDGDGLVDTTDPDDDNDGMPDAYEGQVGLDSLNPADALADLDSDGFSNLVEYRAETDPNDAGSVPSSAVNPNLVAALLPISRSATVGQTVTAFATMINAGGDSQNCTFSPSNALPADFFFRATNPLTNEVIDAENIPVDLPGGASQSFVFAFTPREELAPTAVAFYFACDGSAGARSLAGVNTFLLSASNQPVPDVVALSATPSNDGIAAIPGAQGTGVFSLAAINVGAAGEVSVTASTDASFSTTNLPIEVTLCQTDPATAVCTNPSMPAASVVLNLAQNESATFSLFVRGQDIVPLDPAANRVFVSFRDSTGAVRGSTSVAVATQ